MFLVVLFDQLSDGGHLYVFSPTQALMLGKPMIWHKRNNHDPQGFIHGRCLY